MFTFEQARSHLHCGFQTLAQSLNVSAKNFLLRWKKDQHDLIASSNQSFRLVARKYLEALIFADYNMFTGTLFVNDIGSRHGMMGQNGISLIIYEEYVIRVFRQHSRIIYCEKLLSVLTGNDYDYDFTQVFYCNFFSQFIEIFERKIAISDADSIRKAEEQIFLSLERGN